MRIAKNTELLLTEAPSSRFLLVIDVMDGDVLLQKGEDMLIRIRLVGEDAHAEILYPDGRRKTLYGEKAKGKEVILTAGYARMGLYVGGVLLDEDFFYTPRAYKGATVKAGSFMHFEAGYEYHSADESAIVENVTDSLDGYRPAGHARKVFRVFPTVIGQRLSLMYLDGRESTDGGKSPRKLSALFSDDGIRFHGAPIALGIDNVREEDILDATLLKKDGRYYLYYIVKYTSYRTLSCAVSEDGFSFQKTGLDVEIAGVKASDVTAVAIENAEAPRLYFVANGKAFFAESIDLLHFSSPARIDLPPVDKVIPLSLDGTPLLFAQKDGVLFRVENGSLTPVSGVRQLAHPFFYGGELRYVGVDNGTISL